MAFRTPPPGWTPFNKSRRQPVLPPEPHWRTIARMEPGKRRDYIGNLRESTRIPKEQRYMLEDYSAVPLLEADRYFDPLSGRERGHLDSIKRRARQTISRPPRTMYEDRGERM